MFYHFSQNNSGGKFHFDSFKGITHHVIIEGDDAKEIIYRADRIGLFTDGPGDCPCCGERWSTPWSDEALDETPLIYDTTPTDYVAEAKYSWRKSFPEGKDVAVHYKDGTIKWY